MSIRPITEEDLHGFVDLALDPTRRAEVEVYLESHPEVAARVQAYADQRAALRAAYAPVAEEPIPPELNLSRLIETRRRPAPALWRNVAAALLLVSLGMAGGWTMRGAETRPGLSGMAALSQEAMMNYSVFVPDRRHPVELRAAQSAELVTWISNRLKTKVMVPDLSASGYSFMGGRLVATAHGPAGLLMYDNGQGLKLVMLVRPMRVDKDVANMAQSGQGSMTGFTWSQDGIGYSVVGATAPDVLHPLANEIRRQLTTGI